MTFLLRRLDAVAIVVIALALTLLLFSDTTVPADAQPPDKDTTQVHGGGALNSGPDLHGRKRK